MIIPTIILALWGAITLALLWFGYRALRLLNVFATDPSLEPVRQALSAAVIAKREANNARELDNLKRRVAKAEGTTLPTKYQINVEIPS